MACGIFGTICIASRHSNIVEGLGGGGGGVENLCSAQIVQVRFPNGAAPQLKSSDTELAV